MILKTRNIEKSLLGKGFIERNNDHKFFVFTYNGKEKKIITKISHSHSEISNDLIFKMSKQLFMTKDFFIKFVDCTKSESDYIQILIDKDIIKKEV